MASSGIHFYLTVSKNSHRFIVHTAVWSSALLHIPIYCSNLEIAEAVLVAIKEGGPRRRALTTGQRANKSKMLVNRIPKNQQ